MSLRAQRSDIDEFFLKWHEGGGRDRERGGNCLSRKPIT